MGSMKFEGFFGLFLLLSTLALITGCNGGSSGGDTPLSSDKAITAFSFTAAANPQLGADLTGTINEANGTILLAGPLEADDVAGLKASFTTTGKEVGVGGVAQESGVTANSFAGPLAYRVTAEDGSTRDYRVCVAYWKHPSGLSDNISPDEQDAWFDFQVAMDDNGNALIVWEQSDGSKWQIFKSEYRDGAWIHPTGPDDNISPDEPVKQDARFPQVAMDSNGNALIVWHQHDGINWQIFKSEYRDGTWTHPADLDDHISKNGQDAYEPQVAMDGGGNALIVWRQSDGSNNQIFRSEYRDGAWTHPDGLEDNISPDDQGADSPRVAMDGDGNALIVWCQVDGSDRQIFKSEYRDGAWTDPAGLDNNISPDGESVDDPQVAMDNNGNTLIVWRQSDGDNYQVFRSEYRNGVWTHPTGLDDNISPDGQDAEEPQAAMDASGNAVIVWEQSDGSTWQIFKSEYRDGAWTGPEDLSDNISPDGQEAYPSQAAMDDSGNAVIVWNQSDGVNWQIFKSEYRFWEE